MKTRIDRVLAFCVFGVWPGCSAVEDTGTEVQEVVYGNDDRLDVFEHPDAALRARAQQSSVALMFPWRINDADPNNVTFFSPTLQAARNLCATERFLNDPTAGECSGTLIDDDIVLTAGHCVRTAAECANTRFVFNYYRNGAGTMQPVTTADIFSCAAIIARTESSNIDFAALRLDRPATPRFAPAPVRASAAMFDGQRVGIIGAPSGIPLKIDSGGSVRNARASAQDHFVATTDSFGGNSGSGVYDLVNYTVAGILFAGEDDYVIGACNVVNTCAEDGCSGELVTYVTRATVPICAAHGSMRLCPADQYLVGDWDGDGRDNVAFRYNGCVLMDHNFDGFHDQVQCYGDGIAEDQYLVGDWDGDGRDNLAVRRNNCVLMDFNFDGWADQTQCFGAGNSASQYLVGDWDGDGRDNLAVRNGRTISMDFNFDGTTDRTQTIGNFFDTQYLAGDWNGDGLDNIGIRRGRCVSKDFNFNSTFEATQCYGDGSDEREYMVGDWTNGGIDMLAVRRVNCVWMDFNVDPVAEFIQCYGNGN